MKFAVLMGGQVAASNLQRLRARVDTVQAADARRDKLRPSARSASYVESDRVRLDRGPRKDSEILFEYALKLFIRHPALIEVIPLVAETGNDALIDVGPFRATHAEPPLFSSKKRIS